VLTFANLQLRAAQATDARREFAFSEYFGLRTITTVAGLVVIGLIAALGGFEPVTAAMIVLVGLAKAAESLSDVFYGLFQRHEDLKRVGVSMTLRGAAAVAAMAVMLHITGNVLWGAAAMAAAWGLIWWFHDLRLGRRLLEQDLEIRPASGEPHPLRPSYNKARHVSLFRLALPLGLVIMLVALNQNIPRYFVQYHLGEELLGAFSAMAYAMVAFTGAAEALALSATPRLANHLATGKMAQFRSLLGRLLAIVLALGVGAILLAKFYGPWLLAILYMPSYSAYGDVFVWLSVAGACVGVANIFSSAVTAARCFRSQVPMFVAVALTSATGCYLLVPAGGMLGAAKSAAIGGLVYVLLSSGLLAWVLLRRQKTQARAFVCGQTARRVAPALEA
ncbi:MAG TPA: lipopolysaccharide biosynthesis protein, partial [Bryobacteraceae bacterium]|nr:lipopolysaccharide biosynthesis protein [Bryobacteraceae bacterium]